MKLDEFLQNKPLYYATIDYDRMPRAFKSIKDKLSLKPIIHIVGTNGKGSTGRFLAQLIENLGFSVGHYTSPHIFKFNERFYLNGHDASDDELENAHEILQNLLNDEFKNSLSYFEYATFLAAVLFKNCDYVIFEAGMGAQFDATNVFEKRLSLFTPIGLDHTDMLGKNIEEISYTKLISMDKMAILNDSMNEISVSIAKDIAVKKGTNLKFAKDVLDSKDIEDIKKYGVKFSLANFQISNLSLSTAALKSLNLKPKFDGLKRLNLAGRIQKITPNLTIDVGHNELAAQNILKEFDGKKVVLIYNAFLDKDYKAVLKTLKPIIKRVEIYTYKSTQRKLATEFLEDTLLKEGIEFTKFKKLHENQNYLLFGSFMLVEEFLRRELDKENLC
ncbi:Mur ligase family protein [Campylobacter geochelonis]|uniref:Mur ligase family protein n=1 Tax=Campylobacter geochelonis TaxID=1780362 RepID=UPI00077095FE|nr:Mur ligase family protein [Campylobacter geochelonis]CZE50199.1 folylpolyglutamate synthase [Campylobacter geochelonis]